MTPTVPLLVIEDDATIRRLLCSLLADEGYRLVQACDSHDALLVLQHSLVAMVTLYDACTPCLDGLQLLGALTLDLPALQRHGFILLTANTSQLTAVQQGLLGHRGVALLRKPFAIEALLQTVALTVARIEGHAQPPIQHPIGQQQAALVPLRLRAFLRGKLARGPLRFGLPIRAAGRREAAVQAQARAWARAQKRAPGRGAAGADDTDAAHARPLKMRSLLQLTLEIEE
jgi:CheY-like chemotaxis protein